MHLNIVGRTRRMDTKQFNVAIDVTSNKAQRGIVRIFLGARINSKQQLNDNRNNFVELDQFVVKLSQGNNLIKRNSRDFKNVVADSETIATIYHRTLNQLNSGNNGNSGGNNLNNLNFDTNNNNQGFPHRLVLPKGTVSGEDYTLYVIISDLDQTNYNHVMYDNNMKTRGIEFNGNNDNDNKNEDNFNSNSNESNDNENNNGNSKNQNGKASNNGNSYNGQDYKNGNDYNKHRSGNNLNQNGAQQNNKNFNSNSNESNDSNMSNDSNDSNNSDSNERNSGQNNGQNNNNQNGQSSSNSGGKIHNFSNGNKNIGNGNGIMDNRAMGFPLDRQILDVTGFISNNMFFKDVTIFHLDNNDNKSNLDY